MNIVFDVGNTAIKVGIYESNKLLKKFSFVTDAHKSFDELVSVLSREFKDYISHPCNIIFSSVVPSINVSLKAAINEVFNPDNFVSMSNKLKTGLPIKADNPSEIGNDLIADMVAVKEKYGPASIACDLGTATKIMLFDKDGFYSSVVICPGLVSSAKTLSSSAEQLPVVSLEAPKKVVARNTVDCMNVGLTYGHAEMVMGLVKRTENEIGYPCKHVLSGGNAIFIRSILDDSYIYDENLGMDGLNIILNKNI